MIFVLQYTTPISYTTAVTPNIDSIGIRYYDASRPLFRARFGETEDQETLLNGHFEFVSPDLGLPPLKRFPCFPQTFGFNNARRHAINRIQVNQIRISQNRKSLYSIYQTHQPYKIDPHIPAIPKWVWNTSTISPGLSAIPPPSGS